MQKRQGQERYCQSSAVYGPGVPDQPGDVQEIHAQHRRRAQAQGGQDFFQRIGEFVMIVAAKLEEGHPQDCSDHRQSKGQPQ